MVERRGERKDLDERREWEECWILEPSTTRETVDLRYILSCGLVSQTPRRVKDNRGSHGQRRDQKAKKEKETHTSTIL